MNAILGYSIEDPPEALWSTI